MNILWFLIISFLLSVNSAFAGGFNIKSIGGVETGGQMVSKFWHTSLSPSLRGEATPGANVTVTVDGTALMTAADSSGDWVFTPSGLAAGDHQVSLESGGSKINFTLVLGKENVDWTVAGKGPAETLPTAGTSWPTVLFLVVGGTMLTMGGKMLSVIKK
jgi:hypothetical protein